MPYINIHLKGIIDVEFKPGLVLVRKSGMGPFSEEDWLFNVSSLAFSCRMKNVNYFNIYKGPFFFVLINYNEEKIYFTDKICKLENFDFLKENNCCLVSVANPYEEMPFKKLSIISIVWPPPATNYFDVGYLK